MLVCCNHRAKRGCNRNSGDDLPIDQYDIISIIRLGPLIKYGGIGEASGQSSHRKDLDMYARQPTVVSSSRVIKTRSTWGKVRICKK